MNAPFLTNQQVEELAEFGYVELTDELMQQMAEQAGVDISEEDD